MILDNINFEINILKLEIYISNENRIYWGEAATLFFKLKFILKLEIGNILKLEIYISNENRDILGRVRNLVFQMKIY